MYVSVISGYLSIYIYTEISDVCSYLIYLSAYLSIYLLYISTVMFDLSIYSEYPFIHLYNLSIHKNIYLSAYLSIYLIYIYLYIYISIYISTYRISIYLSTRMYCITLLRRKILNRTSRRHKNLYISLFLLATFGPIYYGPP